MTSLSVRRVVSSTRYRIEPGGRSFSRAACGGADTNKTKRHHSLVASIRLHFADVLLHLKCSGPNLVARDGVLRKGDEMGWFQHGSTLIVLAPDHFRPCARVE
jgi:hypothetical protein